MTYNTDAIVIKKRPWREDDILYTFFTHEKGKVEAIAKSAKKIQSKMAAHLEPFSLVRVMIAEGKVIDKVAGADLQKSFLNIKKNFPKIIMASFCSEVFDQLVSLGVRDKKIFKLLLRYLQVLDEEANGESEKIKNGDFFAKIFIMQLMELLGYAPELYKCVHCKGELTGKEDYFCPEHGGMICRHCPREDHFIKLDLNSIKYLRLISVSDLGEFWRIKLPDGVEENLGRAIQEFMKYRLERNLKSEKYFLRFPEYLSLV